VGLARARAARASGGGAKAFKQQAARFRVFALSRPLRRRTFFTPPVAGADLRAALVASCLRGALPPVDLLRAARRRGEASQGQ
jgi:hypothetical protein